MAPPNKTDFSDQKKINQQVSSPLGQYFLLQTSKPFQHWGKKKENKIL
jgi:hypothetical protein